MIDLENMVAEMVERGASDLFLKAGCTPTVRLDGVIIPLDYDEIRPDSSEEVARSIMSEAQWSRFQEVPEMDLALSLSGIGRFRVNCFRQRGSIGIVLRHISNRRQIISLHV